MSPTARTLAVLRKEGRRAQVVERFIPQAGRRVDLFGFIDLVFLDGRIVGVQCCSGSSHATRRTKILTECREAALEWLRNHGVIEVRSWSKRVVRLKSGKKALRWQERIQEIAFIDFGVEP